VESAPDDHCRKPSPHLHNFFTTARDGAIDTSNRKETG
jgi:hypothetical protein